MGKNETIFGIRTVIEAIKSGKEVDRILIKKGLQGDLFKELFGLIRTANIPFQYVPLEKINRITRKNHQGVIAYISEITYTSIEQVIPFCYEQGKTPLVLILDRITDVRNFGAIARSAECAGVDAIIIPDKGAAQINSDAIKTSAGALHKIAVCRSRNLKKDLNFLKESGLKVMAVTEKASDLYFSADLTQPVAFILGAEDKGIAPELINEADQNIKIPILGEIESLNVSVATSIVCYEAVKQRMNM